MQRNTKSALDDPDSVCEVSVSVLKYIVVYPFVTISGYIPDLEFV
jgi:hypothetical protein